jgi:hypothetical protein
MQCIALLVALVQEFQVFSKAMGTSKSRHVIILAAFKDIDKGLGLSRKIVWIRIGKSIDLLSTVRLLQLTICVFVSLAFLGDILTMYFMFFPVIYLAFL